MPKYRKKPVEIEAMQLTVDNWPEVVRWMTGAIAIRVAGDEHWLEFTTIHGEKAVARPGDWIIPEPVPDRYYPCNPSVFATSYEPVEEAA